MAGSNSQVLMIGLAFLSSLAGIFVDILLSRKRISALHRGIEICERFVFDQINKTIKIIINHYKDEINRILEIPMREISSFLHIMGEGKKSGDYSIQSFEVKDLEIDFMESFKKIKKTNIFIKKLELAAGRIRSFRWIFGIILTIVLILGFFLIVWPNLTPPWFSAAALIVSILSFIIFLFDSIKMNDLIDRTEKEYGISIGE